MSKLFLTLFQDATTATGQSSDILKVEMDFLPLENVEEFDELIEVRAEATKGNPRPSSGNGKERLGSSIRRLSEEKRFQPTNLSKRIIERRESHDRVRLVSKFRNSHWAT